jgi:hypothetical protein
VINSKASLTLEISSSNMDRKTMIHWKVILLKPRKQSIKWLLITQDSNMIS